MKNKFKAGKLMQKLSINIKEVDFEQKKFVDKVEMAIVASTKSQNNLVDELKQQGKIVASVKVEELYLDKAKTRQAVADFVSTQISDKVVCESIISHIVKALDGACVFKKPPVVRKK